VDLESLYKRNNVKVGENCDVNPFCSLENVVLGDNVRIADGVQLKNVVVESGAKISRRVTLYSIAVDRPVLVGRSVWLAYGVFGEATGAELRIGDYAVIAHNTTMLTSSGTGPQSPVLDQFYPVQLGATTIGPSCWIGAQCTVLPGVELGEGTIIGANSMVSTGRYDSWTVYGGTPARRLKVLNPEAVEAAKARVRS
jgi:virginiamycin A acetyltransferase